MSENSGPGAFDTAAATAGIGGVSGQSSSGTTDLYGLGAAGNGPIYVTESNPGMGEHGGGGGYTSVPFNGPNVVDGNTYAKQIAAMSQNNPASFQQWQQMMYAAGFYQGKPRLGVFGADDTNALQAALTAYQQVNGAANTGIANAVGAGKMPSVQPLAFQDWLNQRIAQVKATGGPGANTTKAPLQINYTDPDTLKASIQSNAQSKLGRNLTDHELNDFVGMFHSKEAGAQKAAYNGDSSFTPPEVSGEADQYVQSHNSFEAKQALQASYLDRLNSMFGVL